jgi:membrane dipeptidase
VQGYPNLIFSHGLLKAFASHPRNLYYKQLQALKKQGGLFGLTLANNFVSDDPDCQDLEHFMNHLDEVVKLIGVDNVCFGFDFMDYLSEFPNSNIPEVSDATKVSAILKAMKSRGYSLEQIDKISYSNFHDRYKNKIWKVLNDGH